MDKRIEKLIDRIIIWLMCERWGKRHSAVVRGEDFVVRLYTRSYYEEFEEYLRTWEPRED